MSSIWIMGMAELGADWKAELQCLVDQALKDFGVRCFWNVRTDLPLIPQAKVVVDQLSKHGGVRGLRRAEEIVRRLHGYESPLSSEDVSAGDVHNQVTDRTSCSAVLFYPPIPDADFVFGLHPVDFAVNASLALVWCRDPRAYYHIVRLHRSGLHIAILAWAACGKDPGLTPDLVLDEITRHSRFTTEEIAANLDTPETLDLVQMKRDFLQGVAEARDLFPTLSRLDAGCLYLDAEDNVCLPDAGRLASGELRLHEATIYGAWPETYAWRGP